MNRLWWIKKHRISAQSIKCWKKRSTRQIEKDGCSVKGPVKLEAWNDYREWRVEIVMSIHLQYILSFQFLIPIPSSHFSMQDRPLLWHLSVNLLSSCHDHQPPQHHHGKKGPNQGAELHSTRRAAYYYPLGERGHSHWCREKPPVLHHH